MNKKNRNKSLLKKEFITEKANDKLNEQLQKEIEEKKSAFMERIHLELNQAIFKG